MGPLLAHDWPGNVRELANVLERCLALQGPRITRESIETALAPSRHPGAGPAPFQVAFDAAVPADGAALVPLAAAMDAFERAYVDRVLLITNGNRSQAAQRLGVSLQRLRYRMRRLGMG
jgi:two-component system response regulator PilR (NtrC family)